jgi:hypothetical protein
MSQMPTFAEQTCSDCPSPIVSLLALGLCSDFAALTSAEDLSAPNCKEMEMNVSHFEQLSDCWASEQQPLTYYRTAVAQARKLQADATTPRVKQYLDRMIAHCERLAGKVEPGVSSSRSATIGRSEGFMIGPRSSRSRTRRY